MFDVQRASSLERVDWEAEIEHGIYHIEAFRYPGIQTCTAQNYRHGKLHDSEIEAWLKQEVCDCRNSMWSLLSMF